MADSDARRIVSSRLAPDGVEGQIHKPGDGGAPPDPEDAAASNRKQKKQKKKKSPVSTGSSEASSGSDAESGGRDTLVTVLMPGELGCGPVFDSKVHAGRALRGLGLGAVVTQAVIRAGVVRPDSAYTADATVTSAAVRRSREQPALGCRLVPKGGHVLLGADARGTREIPPPPVYFGGASLQVAVVGAARSFLFPFTAEGRGCTLQSLVLGRHSSRLLVDGGPGALLAGSYLVRPILAYRMPIAWSGTSTPVRLLVGRLHVVSCGGSRLATRGSLHHPLCLQRSAGRPPHPPGGRPGLGGCPEEVTGAAGVLCGCGCYPPPRLPPLGRGRGGGGGGGLHIKAARGRRGGGPRPGRRHMRAAPGGGGPDCRP